MSTIDAEEMRRVVSLARIALIEDEMTKIAADLGVISDAAAEMFEVATPDVSAISHPIPLTNMWHEDVVGPALDHDEILTQTPHPEAGMFGVPQTLEEE